MKVWTGSLCVRMLCEDHLLFIAPIKAPQPKVDPIMRKTLTFLLLSTMLILMQSSLFAQTNPAEVKLEKVYKLLKKDKVDDAEERLIGILKEYASFGKGWDLLSEIRSFQHKQSKSEPNLFGNISITTKDEDGNEIKPENDSLAQRFMDLLSKMDPSELAYSKYLFTLRKATLHSNTAYRSSVWLRNELRVPQVDTMVSTKALKYYNKGETEFAAKNYNKAANFYKRALEHQPDFYKAQLYLADSYYFLGYYLEAIKYFKLCSEQYPSTLEPRKYLIDSYGKEGLYEKALEEAIGSMLVYPDLSNLSKFEDLVYALDKKVTVEWQPRSVFPLAIYNEDKDGGFNQYSDPDESDPSEHWEFYADAQEAIEQYCDKKGVIITPNSLTDARYLEVYGWEQMLENSNSEELAQARKMQQRGYLDCYVLISCFHDDLYDQYHHFVTNNREKALAYFHDVVVTAK